MAAAEHDALAASTRAFVDAVERAAGGRLVSRKQIARTLGVSPNTLSNWFSHCAPPDLGRIRGGASDLSVNKRLGDLEVLCDVPTGTFVALYREVADARTSRRLKRTVQQMDDPHLGLTRVLRAFPVADFAERIRRASRIRLLNTWFPNLAQLEEPLRAALRSGTCTVEVTMLHPYCTAAVTRASTLAYRPGTEPLYSVAGEVRESFRGWARLAAETGAEDRLEVYVYPEIPALAIYQADDHILAGLFLHGRLAVDGPQLEIGAAGSFMEQVVDDELSRVRQGSSGPVTLSSWEQWLNANL